MRLTIAIAMAMAASVVGCSPVDGPVCLTPTPDAAPYVADAVAAWETAGVPSGWLGIGPGGIPVSIDPGLAGRGATLVSAWGDVAWVHMHPAAPLRSWVHELGHVMGAPEGDPATACVMVSGGTCDDITAEDMALAGW